jgi:branched-chain amino acid transport system permease protein
MSAILNDYYLNIVVLTFLWAGLAGAWNLMAGYGGLVSLGHAAFFGTGAYATAIMTASYGLSPWLGLLVGMVVTVVLALAISWPCFRLRGTFFSLATLVFPIAMEIIATNWPELTRGPSGIAVRFVPGLAGFMFRARWPYALAAFIFAAGVFMVSRWIERGRLGLQLMAVRENQDAAEALGVRPVQVKLTVTALSAALTAMGGFFYAQYVLFVDPASVFTINVSIQIALLAIIGGIGTAAGPIVGSLVMTPLDGVLSAHLGGGPRLIVYGLVLLLVVLLAPHGILGTWQLRQTRHRPT